MEELGAAEGISSDFGGRERERDANHACSHDLATSTVRHTPPPLLGTARQDTDKEVQVDTMYPRSGTWLSMPLCHEACVRSCPGALHSLLHSPARNQHQHGSVSQPDYIVVLCQASHLTVDRMEFGLQVALSSPSSEAQVSLPGWYQQQTCSTSSRAVSKARRD